MAAERTRAMLSWSSGKDSAWALHVLRHRDDVDVVALLTTITEPYGRVAMHGVRAGLLRAQADATGLPLWPVMIPSPCSDAEYEASMGDAVRRAVATGVSAVAFGDLFLEDIRAYRERQLAGTGLTPLFPLWLEPTAALARTMLDAGMRAHLASVDPRQIAPAFAGRAWDARLLADLPNACDPCGERGEFHTFVSDGPMFRAPIPITVGDTVERDGFVFADLLPGNRSTSAAARDGR